MITKRQREIADKLTEALKQNSFHKLIAESIKQENEIIRKNRIARTPTRKQMETVFDI